MKLFGLFSDNSFEKEKYLLLEPSAEHILGNTGATSYYDAKEFNDKKELEDYLENDVAKSDRKWCTIYKKDSQ